MPPARKPATVLEAVARLEGLVEAKFEILFNRTERIEDGVGDIRDRVSALETKRPDAAIMLASSHTATPAPPTRRKPWQWVAIGAGAVAILGGLSAAVQTIGKLAVAVWQALQP